MASTPPDIDGLNYIRLLGSGGFADVFLFDQATPARKVAVKVLRETGLSNSTVRGFTNEANAMARLEHPYIVPVYAAGTTRDHRPYIVMMYYARPSLAERARLERFSVAETLQLGIQLGAAVETAHRAGLLHRDIKPANVLTNAYGRPGLTDFGIAGQMTDADDKDLGVSVPWSPPETLYATAPASVRSDVYSLAATLWHLLVGRAPFEIPNGDNSPFAMMRRVRDLPPPSTGRPDVPASLDRLLRAGLGKEPALRPASAMEFVGALQAIEQELRLPRTSVELVAEDASGHSLTVRPAADRTQVRTPQVVSPSTTLPEVPAPTPRASAQFTPQGDVESMATRRGVSKVSPIAGFRDGVEGATVVRGASVVPSEPAPLVAAEGSKLRPVGVIALAVAVLLVVMGVAWFLATGHKSPAVTPSVSVSEVPPDVGAVALPAGKPVITAKPVNGGLKFSWTYPNPLPGDNYRWRLAGANTSEPVTVPNAFVASKRSACIEVMVFRGDGSNAPRDWTKGCSA